MKSQGSVHFWGLDNLLTIYTLPYEVNEES